MPASRDWWLFAGFAALLVIIRLFLVFSGHWYAREGADLPEALISGRGAFDVLNGSWRGWRAYLHYSGGHFGNEMGGTIFALPLFWLMGPSLLAITMMPILLAVAAAAAMFRVSRSRDAALFTTIYFVFMPLDVQSWHLYPYLSHVETMVWFVFALWILEPVLHGQPARAARLFAAGLIVGFGLLMCDIEVLAIPAITTAWYVARAPRPSRRAAMAGVAGLLLAALPYITFAIVKPDAIVSFYSSLNSNDGFLADPLAAIRPVALPAAMLWPVAGLASTPGARLWLGVAMTAGLFWWGRRLIASARSRAVDVAMFTFVAAFCVINVLTRNPVQYYTYTLAAPLAFVLGGVFADVTRRWTPARRRGAIVVMVAVGCLVTGVSLWRAQSTVVSGAARAAWIARGYSFHWPGPYPVFSGFKTSLGERVERVAARSQFQSAPPSAHPEKRIAIAPGDEVRYPLVVRDDYYLYGLDVTAVGIASLAEQVVRDVDPAFWPEAFGSIAVFMANDFLLTELTGMFADGTIERAIPDCCVDAFYAEFGRKVRDRSAERQSGVVTLRDGFTADQRRWFERGLTGSRYVDYHVPKWPARRPPS